MGKLAGMGYGQVASTGRWVGEWVVMPVGKLGLGADNDMVMLLEG